MIKTRLIPQINVQKERKVKRNHYFCKQNLQNLLKHSGTSETREPYKNNYYTMNKIYTTLLLLCLAQFSMSREIHVATHGSDVAPGTAENPLRTINCAAQKAMPGDTVTVHSGTYREWVNPLFGGLDDARRILYRAAEGEKVELKGSELVTGWKRGKNGVWTVTLPNSFFGSFNPFAQEITGDWLDPKGRIHHVAEVYLNDVSLYEVEKKELVERQDTLMRSRRDPDGSPLKWFAQVDSTSTTIYACFGQSDPRKERVEVAVRPTCFYPTREGINYLTVRGFRISQAATQWAAPTAEQIGMVAAHWCRGWIIENNIISNSRCNGISLGKQASTGHNLWSQRRFDGATEYIECTFNALRKGWNRENVGSHIIRNNEISYCEQTGICGSMGAAFSQVYGNHIHHIWVKQQFDGAEISGIKFHAAIDAYIHHNRIHSSQKGIWMDWMAQGSRLSCNLLYGNLLMDVFYEVDHGPFTCDNNIMLSDCSILDMSEGGAYVHNLLNGTISALSQSRYTPYHLNHSTEVRGLKSVDCGDNRFYNNILSSYGDGRTYGLSVYDQQPQPSRKEDNILCKSPQVKLEESEGKVYLTFIPSERIGEGKPVDTGRLGVARLSNFAFESADGAPLRFDRDYLGKERTGSPRIGPLENERIERVLVWE